MINEPETSTVCSYEQWLEFRRNRYNESLYDKWKALLESENKPNALTIQPQEGHHATFNLSEFIETNKNNFIGFCITPVFLYNSKVYSVKTVKTTKNSIEDIKIDAIEFLNSKKNLILYDVDFYGTTHELTGLHYYTMLLRYGEIIP